ncbi:hypothetical protein QR680_007304 [Steinernema hermaphroditum]|uniref:Uncharacterized protein n=1 Tax=Steinernema hermaphroditum TaxID=289476 RepID=A0AA39IED5_9BILA|nr:hypothetical protein QR680_007304 [Steinernema hermaphroditum]
MLQFQNGVPEPRTDASRSAVNSGSTSAAKRVRVMSEQGLKLEEKSINGKSVVRLKHDKEKKSNAKTRRTKSELPKKEAPRKSASVDVIGSDSPAPTVKRNVCSAESASLSISKKLVGQQKLPPVHVTQREIRPVKSDKTTSEESTSISVSDAADDMLKSSMNRSSALKRVHDKATKNSKMAEKSIEGKSAVKRIRLKHDKEKKSNAKTRRTKSELPKKEAPRKSASVDVIGSDGPASRSISKKLVSQRKLPPVHVTQREMRPMKSDKTTSEKSTSSILHVTDDMLKKAFLQATEKWTPATGRIQVPKTKPPFRCISFKSKVGIFNFVPCKHQLHKRVFRFPPDPWRRYASRKKVHELGGYVYHGFLKEFIRVAKGSRPPPPPDSFPVMTEKEQLQRMANLTTFNRKCKRKTRRKIMKESADN